MALKHQSGAYLCDWLFKLLTAYEMHHLRVLTTGNILPMPSPMEDSFSFVSTFLTATPHSSHTLQLSSLIPLLTPRTEYPAPAFPTARLFVRDVGCEVRVCRIITSDYREGWYLLLAHWSTGLFSTWRLICCKRSGPVCKGLQPQNASCCLSSLKSSITGWLTTICMKWTY